MKEEVPIRIRVLRPSRDVRFGVQRGRAEVVAPTDFLTFSVRSSRGRPWGSSSTSIPEPSPGSPIRAGRDGVRENLGIGP